MADLDNCDKLITSVQGNPVGAPPPVVPCVEEPKKLPQELRETTGEAPGYKAPPLPKQITLYSEPVLATCQEDVMDLEGNPGEGDQVSLPEGTYKDTISVQTVAGVDQSVLTYIAENNIEDEIETALRNSTLTRDALVSLIGIQPSQADTFLNLAQSKLKSLNAAAKALAISQLKCVWWNDAQSATCETDLGFQPGTASKSDHPNANNATVVAERTVSSSSSKQQANAIAKAQAIAALECFFVSDAVIADCTEHPSGLYTEWVPTDPEGTVPRRVGQAALPYAAVISSTSKQDATDAAQQLAYSMLDCFYLSREVDVRCEDPEARAAGVNPDGTVASGLYLSDSVTVEEVQAMYPEDERSWEVGSELRKPSQRIVVPAGYFTSQVSTADATSRSRTLAESLLSCCFISDRIFIECPPEADKDYSPVWEYELARGAFISCKSKKEANEQAWTAATGIVDCVFCNDIIVPQCVPDWVVSAVTTGIRVPADSPGFFSQGVRYEAGDLFKLELPLKVEGLVNPYTGKAVEYSEWSIDATVGVAPDTVCSASKREVNELVELMPAMVTEPKTGVPSCRFKSTRLLAGCAFDDPYFHYSEEGDLPTIGVAPREPFEGVDKTEFAEPSAYGTTNSYLASILYEPEPITYYHTDNEGRPYRIFKMKPTQALAAKLSNPIPGSYIEFPEGLLTASAADIPGYEDKAADLTLDQAASIVRDYLDGIVLEMAKGMLMCRYGNPKTYVACAWDSKFPSLAYSPTGYYITDSTAIDALSLSPEPFIHPDEVGDPAYEPYMQFGDPRADAWWVGHSKTDEELYPESYMAPGGALRNDPVIIPQFAIQGERYNDVLEQTKALAQSLIFCQYMNAEVECSTSCESGIPISGPSQMIIPDRIIQADTHPEATRIARTMLACGTECLYYSPLHVCMCDNTHKATTLPEGFFVSNNPVNVGVEALNDYCELLCSSLYGFYKKECQYINTGTTVTGVTVVPYEIEIPKLDASGTQVIAGITPATMDFHTIPLRMNPVSMMVGVGISCGAGGCSGTGMGALLESGACSQFEIGSSMFHCALTMADIGYALSGAIPEVELMATGVGQEPDGSPGTPVGALVTGLTFQYEQIPNLTTQMLYTISDVYSSVFNPDDDDNSGSGGGASASMEICAITDVRLQKSPVPPPGEGWRSMMR